MSRRAPFRSLLALLALAAVSCPASARPAPARIVDGWYAHNATLIMLGASRRIVGTVVAPDRFRWMYRVAPWLAKAHLFPSMSLGAEAVLALHPDLVFVTRQSNVADGLRALGLDAVPVGFTDFAGMLDTIDDTAARLDTDEARQQAQRYRAAFTALLGGETAHPVGHRPRVLHIAAFDPLTVDGDRTIIDEWIRHAGGVNAAEGLHGNKRPVSIEQILAWSPDVIILGADAGMPDRSGGAGLWDRLAAVRNGQVFRNPAGVFNWDRYSPELLLQLSWARQIVATGRIDRPDMIDRIRKFYRSFYDVALTPDDAGRILDAMPPR